MVAQLGATWYLMGRTIHGKVQYAPMYIATLPMCTPCKVMDTIAFLGRYDDYSEISNISERVKWCRCRAGMMQEEVAQAVEISREVYHKIETGDRVNYPPEIMDKLARLFGVPATDFMDGYTCFLANGQGRQLLEMRKSFGMSRKNFAKLLNVAEKSIYDWELENKQISRKCWEKYLGEIGTLEVR